MSEKLPKIRVAYGVQRSGSTYIAGALGEYFENVESRTYLSEYFNLDFEGAGQIQENRIVPNHGNWLGKSSGYYISEELYFEKIEQRMEALEKSEGRYFLKIFPEQIPQGMEDRLLSQSEIIFLKRENLLEQVESFLISAKSNRWYEPDGLDFGGQMLSVELVDFALFCQRIAKMENLIQTNPKSEVLIFEEILRNQKISLEKQTCDILSLQRKFLPKKQNNIDKKLIIKNHDELVSWYKKSLLQKMRPI